MKTILFSYVVAIIGSSILLHQEPKLKESIQRGAEIYADFCVTCHMGNGEGVANTFPPLAKSDYLMNNREASIKGIKYGQQGELTVNGIVYNNTMDQLGLEDEEIADVMNYILNSWGNSSDQMVILGEVESITK
jgi:mono/diheme cytochrome c family protein